MNKQSKDRSGKRPAKLFVPIFREIMVVCIVICITGCLTSCGRTDRGYGLENNDAEGYGGSFEEETHTNEEILTGEGKLTERGKQIITLGTASSLDDVVRKAIVRFNRENLKYQIQVVDYTEGIDFNASNDVITEALNDARMRMRVDIATGNGTDIIDLQFLGTKYWMEKGMVEDLYPYLRTSDVVNVGDLNAAVLNAYEVDGRMPCIPTDFQIVTLIARQSDMGEREAWTVKELMELADIHSDCELIDYADKLFILKTIMMRDAGNYYDMSTGKCYYDTAEFKEMLKFANRFPDRYVWHPFYQREGLSESKMLAAGQMLLKAVGVGDFTDVQIHSALFQDDFTYIGYPTRDGSNGSLISGNHLYGIYTKSGQKEGAWEFLESLQTQIVQGSIRYGFPMLNSVYEKRLRNEMSGVLGTDEYVCEDLKVELHAVTGEEADRVTALIAKAVRIDDYYEEVEINQIIEEEAGAYFAGQKSVDETAELIQNRVSVYVRENM